MRLRVFRESTNTSEEIQEGEMLFGSYGFWLPSGPSGKSTPSRPRVCDLRSCWGFERGLAGKLFSTSVP